MASDNLAAGPPPATATAYPAGALRVRRAIALPMDDQDLGGNAAVAAVAALAATGTGAAVAAGATARHPVATAAPATDTVATASGQPQPAGRSRFAARLFPAPAVQPPAPAQPPAEEQAPAEEAAVPAALLGDTAATAGATGAMQPAEATAQAARLVRRPLLTAAAVAGAVLVSIPFVAGQDGRGTTTNYEGLGQQTPVASLSPEPGASNRPDGYASDMPLQDPAEGGLKAAVPQPQTGVPLTPGAPNGVGLTGVPTTTPATGNKELPAAGSPSPQGPGAMVKKSGPAGSPPHKSPLGKAVGTVAGALGLSDGLKSGTGPRSQSGSSAGEAQSHPLRRVETGGAPVRQQLPNMPATATPGSSSARPKADDSKATTTVGKAPAQAVTTPATAVTTAVKAATTMAKPGTTAARTQTAAAATPAAKPATAATPAAKPATTAKPAAAAAAARTADPQPAAASGWSTRVVNSTYVIGPGQSVASNRMRMSMLTNGNLVISDENGVVRWSSHTEGRGYQAVFQADGNFVVYTQDQQTAWSSGSAGHPGAEMVIQDDGNVTISDHGSLLWSAGTQH